MYFSDLFPLSCFIYEEKSKIELNILLKKNHFN